MLVLKCKNTRYSELLPKRFVFDEATPDKPTSPETLTGLSIDDLQEQLNAEKKPIEEKMKVAEALVQRLSTKKERETDKETNVTPERHEKKRAEIVGMFETLKTNYPDKKTRLNQLEKEIAGTFTPEGVGDYMEQMGLYWPSIQDSLAEAKNNPAGFLGSMGGGMINQFKYFGALLVAGLYKVFGNYIPESIRTWAGEILEKRDKMKKEENQKEKKEEEKKPSEEPKKDKLPETVRNLSNVTIVKEKEKKFDPLWITFSYAINGTPVFFRVNAYGEQLQRADWDTAKQDYIFKSADIKQDIVIPKYFNETVNGKTREAKIREIVDVLNPGGRDENFPIQFSSAILRLQIEENKNRNLSADDLLENQIYKKWNQYWKNVKDSGAENVRHQFVANPKKILDAIKALPDLGLNSPVAPPEREPEIRDLNSFEIRINPVPQETDIIFEIKDGDSSGIWKASQDGESLQRFNSQKNSFEKEKESKNFYILQYLKDHVADITKLGARVFYQLPSTIKEKYGVENTFPRLTRALLILQQKQNEKSGTVVDVAKKLLFCLDQFLDKAYQHGGLLLRDVPDSLWKRSVYKDGKLDKKAMQTFGAAPFLLSVLSEDGQMRNQAIERILQYLQELPVTPAAAPS